MQRITRNNYPLESLQRILNGVTFFKSLINDDPEQFEALMSVTQFVTAEPDEEIISKDEPAANLYFLLRGELTVFDKGQINNITLNQTYAGEVFGVMSMVLNKPRTASMKVVGKQALLASIHFDFFKDINDFSVFNLSTKLQFFKMVDNNLRWTLERNKQQSPNHPLAEKIRKLPIYTGPKGEQQELNALFALAHQLAELIDQWNQYGKR